ncbi:MAG: hypothetical protein HY741_29965 [Chloroflexi bacterium]|nr:hypothetical protein [Chloroflexota bacterium]
MLLAIDPEVFVAAFKVDESEAVNLAAMGYKKKREREQCTFVVDRGKDSITGRYQELYEEWNRVDNLKVYALGLLKLILDDFANDRAWMVDPGCCAMSIRELIEDQKIETPYEPHLVRLAWGVYGKATGQSDRGVDDVEVILVGPQIEYESPHRERKMYVPEVEREVWRKIPWVHVEFASRTEIALPGQKPREPEPVQKRLFERMSRDEACDHFSCWPAVDPTPPEIKDKYGDVDVYVRERSGTERWVWVGECKMRH